MTRYQNNFNMGTEGANVSLANLAASGTAPTALEGPTPYPAYLAAAAFNGAMGIRTNANAAQSALRHQLPASVNAAACRFYFRAPSILTGADGHLMRFTTAANARLASVHISGYNSGKLFVADVASPGTPKHQTVAGITANVWYCVDVYINQSAALLSFDLYQDGAGSTPVSTYRGTSVDVGSGASIANVWMGKVSTDGRAYDFDEWVWDDAATGLIGPYAQPLTTPVVTLGAKTSVTTPGGSDGTQTVTWGAVSGAAGYDAYRASSGAPTQEDFTLVAAGVASPYTFTNLAPGQYAYGIKAKA